MKKLEMDVIVLNEEKLLEVDGRAISFSTNGGSGWSGNTIYYGNGLSCNSEKCWVDWGTADTCIAYAIGGWAGAIPEKC